jgi:hypothetical protein
MDALVAPLVGGGEAGLAQLLDEVECVCVTVPLSMRVMQPPGRCQLRLLQPRRSVGSCSRFSATSCNRLHITSLVNTAVTVAPVAEVEPVMPRYGRAVDVARRRSRCFTGHMQLVAGGRRGVSPLVLSPGHTLGERSMRRRRLRPASDVCQAQFCVCRHPSPRASSACAHGSAAP